MFSLILLPLEAQKHEKARVLASFCQCNFLEMLKNIEFYPKTDQAAVQKVAKTRVFTTFCCLNVSNVG